MMSNLGSRTALGLALIAALMVGALGCTAESKKEPARHGAKAADDQGAQAHAHGPHDGMVEKVGSAGHVEMVHDAAAGCVDLYILAADQKTPAKADAPPMLNLKTDAGPKQLTSEAADGEGHYRAVDDALKNAHPSGQIVVKMGGKEHIVMLAHHHHGDAAHEHGAGEDKHEKDDGHEHEKKGD